jgi:hypothetical protein
MSRKPNKPAVARSLDSRSVSDRDAVAGASVCQSAPTVAVERTQPAPEARPKVIVVETPDDPEPIVVTAESAEELVRTTFTLLVGRLGDRRARALWRAALKRDRGRPPGSFKYNPALFLLGIRQLERKMPKSSLTQVVTEFVRDIESRGFRYGASTDATVRRLVRDLKFFRKHGHFRGYPNEE